jgi:hypothetical protein
VTLRAFFYAHWTFRCNTERFEVVLRSAIVPDDPLTPVLRGDYPVGVSKVVLDVFGE